MIPFVILASVFDNPKYLLKEAEKTQLADQWDMVIWKYAPGLLEEYGPEYLLAGSISLMLIHKSGFLTVKTGKDNGDGKEAENAE